MPPASADDPDAVLAAARVQVLPDIVGWARELFAGGIDLTQYNSRTIARDTVAFVAALGYDRYNLYGISYGGRVALTIMRDHPRSGLRSVVLDSPYPPNLPGYEQSPGLPHEVATQFFADCALDPACGAAYPDLKDRFVALLAKLTTDPILASDGTTIDAADLIELLQSIDNQTRILPYLPLMIAELEQGRTDTYQGIVSGELFAQRQPPPDAPGSVMDATPATPPTDAATSVDDAAAFAADEAAPSPARQWLREVEVRAQTLPGDYSAAALQLLIMLDKLPRTRATLDEFVIRAFEGAERAADREALLAAIAAMTDDDVRQVFAIVAEAPDSVDTDSSGINAAMFNSVECHEAIRFERFRDAAATVRTLDVPALAAPLELVAAQFARCEVWPSGTAPDVEFEAVVSDAPTLLMAGAYDVQTPVSWSKLVFLSLPNAYYAFFPMAGHGTVFYSDCAQAVGADFVDRPDRLPDLACTADLEPTFVLPPAATSFAGATLLPTPRPGEVERSR